MTTAEAARLLLGWDRLVAMAFERVRQGEVAAGNA